jgi:hypothetical protein
MNRRTVASVMAWACLLPGVSGALAQSSDAAPAQREAAGIRFRSPAECAARHGIDIPVCAEFAQRAWDIYTTQAPRFSTREQCSQSFEVCVVFMPEWIVADQGAPVVMRVVRFGPPLWAIEVQGRAASSALTVLIDRAERPLAALQSAVIMPVGRFSPTPEMLRQAYREALAPAPARSEEPRQPAPPSPPRR